MQRKLDAKKRSKLIYALANPENKTRSDVADEMGVERSTVWRWIKANPSVLKEAHEISCKLSEETAALSYGRLHRIVTQGKDADALGAIRLLAQLRGELIDRSEGKTKIEGEVKLNLEAEISDADARRIATALLARREKK